MIKEFIFFFGGIGMASIVYSYSAAEPAGAAAEVPAVSARSAPVPQPEDAWESDYADEVDADSVDSIAFGEPTTSLDDNAEASGEPPEGAGNSGAAAAAVALAAAAENRDRPERASQIRKMNQSPPDPAG
tara:strand:+ start:3005 stop:3394 length:390 start_codon:yes stop_codon:yes gene_type:complete